MDEVCDVGEELDMHTEFLSTLREESTRKT
jgi:hypothetical protein